ncbi:MULTISPECIES: hypothetical protein [Actinomycetes]|uniref:Uncharacterized protein n=3 Tax=Nocardia TaxID=1817 RepID=A0A4R6PNV7_NOCIG|nr:MULTISPECIES: hypothetical protein [Nocardia]KAF0848046.1 hypothetical protein FNL39_102193 [Nocardia caishijiensis]MCA2209989.1 hypothetical protein [Nocardia rosealba]NKX88906.1 hypothetical protein [Nocardia coubleae]TDP39573.1 hypothetical protein DFR75_102291 [Nocardia ignorata]
MASPLLDFILQPAASEVAGSALRFIQEQLEASPIVDFFTGSATPDNNMGSSTGDHNLGSSTGDHQWGSTYP